MMTEGHENKENGLISPFRVSVSLSVVTLSFRRLPRTLFLNATLICQFKSPSPQEDWTSGKYLGPTMCQIIPLGALGIQPRTTKRSHATGICYGKMGAKITLKEQGKLPERAGIVVLPLMTSNSTSREH